MSATTNATIAITVNGDEREVPAEHPLTAVLETAGVDPESASGVAVALNNSVVRRQDWDDITLADNDTVEIVTAQQGG